MSTNSLNSATTSSSLVDRVNNGFAASLLALGIASNASPATAGQQIPQTSVSTTEQARSTSTGNWVYDIARDPDNIKIREQNERNKAANEGIRAFNDKILEQVVRTTSEEKKKELEAQLKDFIPKIPYKMRPELVSAEPPIEVFYNPKTRQKTEPDNFYWTKSGEITKKGPSDFIGEAGIIETGSSVRMTVSHPDRGELRPVPMAMVSKTALEQAGGILTPEVLATDMRSQGYVYRAATPPEPSAEIPQRNRTSPAAFIQQIEETRAAAIAAQPALVMPTQAPPAATSNLDAMREALAKMGVRIPEPTQPAGVLTETHKVAAAPAPQAIPQTSFDLQSVLAQPGKPLAENYGAAVKAMNAIGQEKITPDQIKDVIQSFRAADLDKFADALDKLNKGETSFLKTGDVLHVANREYRSATQVQAPRPESDAADIQGTIRDALRELPTAMAQTKERMEQAQAQASQARAALGYLMASPETQRGVNDITRKVAEEFKIDPMSLSQNQKNQIGAEVGRIIEQKLPDIQKVLTEQGESAAREALLKVHEEALREVIKNRELSIQARMEPLTKRDVIVNTMLDGHREFFERLPKATQDHVITEIQQGLRERGAEVFRSDPPPTGANPLRNLTRQLADQELKEIGYKYDGPRTRCDSDLTPQSPPHAGASAPSRSTTLGCRR